MIKFAADSDVSKEVPMKKENAVKRLKALLEKRAEGEGGAPLRTNPGYTYGTVSSAVHKEVPEQGERGLMNDGSKTASILSKTFHQLANR